MNKRQYDYDLKIVRCMVCGSNRIKDLFVDHRNIQIGICENCGFQFMNPPYTDTYLTDYYSKYTDDNDYEKWREPLLYGHNFYLSLIERYQQNIGSLLDIGCGNGYLLEAAQKRGWQVEGFEVDAQVSQTVGKRLHTRVYSGDFFDAPLMANYYDLITMHQVLEHLKNPRSYLDRIHALLKDDGYLFIAVPNIHSMSSRFKFRLEKLGLRKKRIGAYYDTEHHLSYFTKAVMKIFLESAGFDVVYQRNCHTVRSNQGNLKRFLSRNLIDHLFTNSAFLMIAKKRSPLKLSKG